MTAEVLIAGFSGLWWLAFLALPILLSFRLCVKFFEKKENTDMTGKMVRMKNEL